MANIYTFYFPDIGEGVVEGEVVQWLKKIGDRIAKDEPIVAVMTDKATVELPSPHPGVLHKQYYKEGEVAIKDQPLYDLEVDAGIVGKSTASAHAPKPAPKEKKATTASTQHKCSSSSTSVLALPQVRHLAKELGINIEEIQGTGPEGRILLSDLKGKEKGHHPGISSPMEGDEEKPLIGVRGLMARNMDKFHIPQFSYFEQVDVTRLIQLRQNIKEKAHDAGIQLSYMPFFIKALSLVALQYPLLNSSIHPSLSSFIQHQQHNVGIAMASSQGLIVPVLKGIQKMKLEELIRAYEELKSKSAAGKFHSEDMKGATISISNFGILGEGLWATPMVSAPEVAILGVGRIHKAPVIRDDQMSVRDVLHLSWSFDHRLIDGAMAAAISHEYCSLLRDPARLL